MPNDEVKHRSGRRKTIIMSQEDAKSGKQTRWDELEITGMYRISSLCYPALKQKYDNNNLSKYSFFVG